jgi:tripartite ATP-independent transporter DctM subunit
MVVYGAVAGTSIGGLFLAGIIPGIIVGLTQMGVSYYFAVKDHYGAKRNVPTFSEIIYAAKKGIWPVLLIVIIIGGIVGGVYTATEAAAISVVYVVLIGIFVRRTLTRKIFFAAAYETANMTAVVLFCVATATLFAWLMTYYNALDPVSYFFMHYSNHPVLFLFYVIVIFIFLGTFMDPVPAMVIVVPILVPIAARMNIHPLLMGILIVMALCIGKITPPYGISLLLACAIAEVPLSKSLKYTLIFFVTFCVVMIVIIFLPEIALMIPRYVMPELFAQ